MRQIYDFLRITYLFMNRFSKFFFLHVELVEEYPMMKKFFSIFTGVSKRSKKHFFSRFFSKFFDDCVNMSGQIFTELSFLTTSTLYGIAHMVCFLI